MIIHDDPRLDPEAISFGASTPFQTQLDQTSHISNDRRVYLINEARKIRDQIVSKHRALVRFHLDCAHWTERELANYVRIGLELDRRLPNPSDCGVIVDGPYMILVDHRYVPYPIRPLNLPHNRLPSPDAYSDLAFSTSSPVAQQESSAASSSASRGRPSRLRADAPSFVPIAQGPSLLPSTSAFPPPISNANADPNPNPAYSANPAAPSHIVPTAPDELSDGWDSTIDLPELSAPGNSQGTSSWTGNPPRAENSPWVKKSSGALISSWLKSLLAKADLPSSQSQDESSADRWICEEETRDLTTDVETPNPILNAEHDQIAPDQEYEEYQEDREDRPRIQAAALRYTQSGP